MENNDVDTRERVANKRSHPTSPLAVSGGEGAEAAGGVFLFFENRCKHLFRFLTRMCALRHRRTQERGGGGIDGIEEKDYIHR